MRARDVAPTRFERARAEALALLARLTPGQETAVVLAAPHPILLSAPTADRGATEAVLRAAAPWDAAADVPAAVTLAAQQQPGPDARIVVWTDAARGSLPALDGVSYRLIGTSDDHVGISTFRVLRDPQQTEVLVRVTNGGAAGRRVPLDVRLGDARIYDTVLDVPGGESRTVTVPVAGAGVLRARIDVRDVLPDDHEAVAVVDPTPLPSVLLVTGGNPYLERVLRVLPVARADETRAVAPAAWGGYGVVVLDRIDAAPLPPGNYLIFGAVPSNLPASAASVLVNPEIATWDRTDPVLRFVDLSHVRIARALALAPEGGRVLASGPAPLLWAYEGRGVRALVVAFALEDSDLPLRAAFPVLMANALEWLGGTIADARVGDDLQVPAGDASAATLFAPDGRRTELRPTDGVFVLPPFTRAGLYRLSTGGTMRLVAVSIDSAAASVIRPGRTPSEAPSPARSAPVSPGLVSPEVLVRVPLWPWLAVAAIGAVLGEWVLATRRGGDA
jgi:hypothetical protein